MRTFYLSLIVVLICSCTFMSCERIPQMTEILIPDEEAMEPSVDIDNIDDTSVQMIPVVINELMADNDNTVPDPQGDYDDWLELYNRTDNPIMLTGMYLSDKEDNPTKWRFPEGTEIPANGFLIVWLDEDHNDETATEELHANFKLSKSGETVLLVDTDANGNQVLDSVTFGEQEADVAYGRIPNGTGEFETVVATPGAANGLSPSELLSMFQ